jgi:tRNA-Thr(GGU) m(6)t(6)A37 methyltransferase TsaA
MSRTNRHCFQPVGYVRSCYKEKFGIPRQPGLVPAARAVLELVPPYDRPEAVQGLEDFSHVWLLFVFHGIPDGAWKPTVRPPRLGGNRRIGVFASRSMFRPNPIGLSLVELERLERDAGTVRLHLKGVDLLDGTPVLDIKPYLPYVEAVPGARAGYASTAPEATRTVSFSDEARATLKQQQQRFPELEALIVQTLSQDPRPAYAAGDSGEAGRQYGMRLLDFDLHWQVEEDTIRVLDIVSQD